MPKACKPKRKKGRRRVKSSGKRKSAKRVAAGKKAARTRKRHLKKDHKAKHPRKRKSGKRKGRKSGKRKAHRKGHRKSRKRVLAGRKAAATRKARRSTTTDSGYDQEPEWVSNADEKRSRRRRKHRKSRRKNPVAALALANPIGRRRHRRRNPIPFMFANPISGPKEFLAGLLGVGMGYAAADLADRLLATHPLVSTSAGYVDSPPAGMVYDSEAPLTPIWSSPVRFIGGIAMVFAPALLSRLVPGNAAKAFFQLAGYGAAAKLGGKLISDGIASTMSTTGLALQAYGPEIAAQTRFAQVAGVTPNSAQAGFFAGPPRGQTRQLGAPTKVGCGNCGQDCGGGCGSAPISSDPIADAQGAMASGQPFVSTSLDSGSLNWQSDPAVCDNSQDCAPMPITQPTLNNLPSGGPMAPAPAAPAPMAPAPSSNCTPGQVWNAAIQQCVNVAPAPGYGPTAPPPHGMAANGPPAPTPQVVPVATVAVPTTPTVSTAASPPMPHYGPR